MKDQVQKYVLLEKKNWYQFQGKSKKLSYKEWEVMGGANTSIAAEEWVKEHPRKRAYRAVTLDAP